MTDSNGSRTLFQSLRVPFDLKAIFLAFLGLVVLWAGGLVLDTIYEGVAVSKAMSDYKKARPDATDEQKSETRKRVREATEINAIPCMVQESLRKLKVPLRAMPVIGTEIDRVVEGLYGEAKYSARYKLDEGERYGLSTIEFVIALVWWFLVLAVFGGAICRIVASRIARDEGVGVKEALRFSIKNIPSYLLAPVAVGLAILFFWACILLAGVVASIPILGPVLNLILYPLVILAGLIIVLIGFGGLLGLLLMVSAISTERNGALDAISRAFSYIYSRPLQFFFAYFLIFLFAYIILLVGHIFVAITASAFDTGVWADQLTSHLERNTGQSAFTPELKDTGFYGLAHIWVWLLHRILWWGIGGYVVYYILGGTTAVYFQLRREVDGTEESEIYLEDGEDDEFDFAVPPASEQTPAAPAPEPPPVPETMVEPSAPATEVEPPAPSEEPPTQALGEGGEEPAGDEEKKDEGGGA